MVKVSQTHTLFIYQVNPNDLCSTVSKDAKHNVTIPASKALLRIFKESLNNDPTSAARKAFLSASQQGSAYSYISHWYPFWSSAGRVLSKLDISYSCNMPVCAVPVNVYQYWHELRRIHV